jgi:hypothetical protein
MRLHQAGSATRNQFFDRCEAKVNVLPLVLLGDFVREIQSATGEELDALLLWSK